MLSMEIKTMFSVHPNVPSNFFFCQYYSAFMLYFNLESINKTSLLESKMLILGTCVFGFEE